MIRETFIFVAVTEIQIIFQQSHQGIRSLQFLQLHLIHQLLRLVLLSCASAQAFLPRTGLQAGLASPPERASFCAKWAVSPASRLGARFWQTERSDRSGNWHEESDRGVGDFLDQEHYRTRPKSPPRRRRSTRPNLIQPPGRRREASSWLPRAVRSSSTRIRPSCSCSSACSGRSPRAVRRRILPKLRCLVHSLRQKFHKDEHFRTPLIETRVATVPELPHDILMGVFATLEIPDLIRAGSVCSSWHSAYSSLRNLGKYKQYQTPCLLFTSESAGESIACLYSLVEKRVYKITLPEPPIRRRFLIGSSLGWLVTVDETSEMHLLNPITAQQIALPSVVTMEHVKPIYNDCGAVHKYEYSRHTAKMVHCPPSVHALDNLRDYLYFKAFIFSDTSTGRCMVVLIHNPFGQLSFARVGGDTWTWLPPYTDYKDCTYKGGLLYALNAWGQIHAFDLSGPVVKMNFIVAMPRDLDFESMYIVQAPWGDLLYVWRIATRGDFCYGDDPATALMDTTEIQIHEVDVVAEELVQINCLRNHVLFLGHNQSLCLRAQEYPPFKANHVYFTDDIEMWIMQFKNNRRDIGVLDTHNNCTEELESPQLWSNWPTPVWITPSFTTMKP